MKEYEVIGPHAVDGHWPGTTFKAAYSDDHERYLVTAGHIRVVPRQQRQNSDTKEE